MRQVGVIGEMLFGYRLGRSLFLDRDQLAGGVARHQAGRAMDGGGLDQPAHLVIEARYDGAHVAKLATDQAKFAVRFSRSVDMATPSAKRRVEVVGMPFARGALPVISRCIVASGYNSTPVRAESNALYRAAMPLTAQQRNRLLVVERGHNVREIAGAIRTVLRDNPTADLLDIEQLFRAAAGTAYLVADGDEFHITIGMKNWIAELNALGRSPEGNRTLLAGEPT